MFEIGLQKCETQYDLLHSNNKERIYKSDEIESVQDLIMVACERLHELGSLKFFVKGFGEDTWKVDVWYDLSTVIGQLPSFFEWIDKKGGDIYELDFFGQGIERSLLFKVIDDQVKIECKSRTNWQPSPKLEICNLLDLDEMFFQLFELFISEVKQVFPDLAKNTYLLQMCHSPHIVKRLLKKK